MIVESKVREIIGARDISLIFATRYCTLSKKNQKKNVYIWQRNKFLSSKVAPVKKPKSAVFTIR